MVGAKPVIADVDRDSQNITAETIRAKITPRTRAIIAVHLAGWPCDMDPILAIARERNLRVIEDCAQAHGARYKGKPVGSIGDVGTFSFCQDKIITTGGEGGMITLSDEAQWKFAWSFKDHGKSYDAVYHQKHPPGFRWLHESFGTNWRLTEMQAVLGRNALRRLDNWVAIRRRNAEILRSALTKLSAIRVPHAPADIHHSYYKFYAFVEPRALKSGWTRDRIMQEINDRGVPCFVGSCSEFYLEKAFTSSAYECSPVPVARELGATSLMFLVHPTLNEDEMASMVEVAVEVLGSATR
jgi:dTDP-4-amino-4,6-dideoxygalactose transaminase